jgi:hypothetical protein
MTSSHSRVKDGGRDACAENARQEQRAGRSSRAVFQSTIRDVRASAVRHEDRPQLWDSSEHVSGGALFSAAMRTPGSSCPSETRAFR